MSLCQVSGTIALQTIPGTGISSDEDGMFLATPLLLLAESLQTCHVFSFPVSSFFEVVSNFVAPVLRNSSMTVSSADSFRETTTPLQVCVAFAFCTNKVAILPHSSSSRVLLCFVVSCARFVPGYFLLHSFFCKSHALLLHDRRYPSCLACFPFPL